MKNFFSKIFKIKSSDVKNIQNTEELYFPNMVEQILHPLGGKILKPENWHYLEAHDDLTYNWYFSEENIKENKGYTTGVRIQLMVSPLKNTGCSAKERLIKIFNEKQKEAQQVIQIRPETNEGLFISIGLELIEGVHHTMYSFAWGSNDMDMAIIIVSGTKNESWNKYHHIFLAMQQFEVIDQKYLK
ncbi:hypothetical protein [Acinetobacter sp. CFCC 10889]|uniref:hypothetical protein n=1 Tax=Acinetobacter sp. CFCC 10889 TaxID=1775557 RepID=UPI000DD035C2|nr:hypothetical protein [Acinetobacter sp. CFCC 10889]